MIIFNVYANEFELIRMLCMTRTRAYHGLDNDICGVNHIVDFAMRSMRSKKYTASKKIKSSQ